MAFSKGYIVVNEYMSVRLLDKSDPTEKYIYPLLFNIHFSLKDNFNNIVIRPLTFTVIWAMFSNFSTFLFIYFYLFFPGFQTKIVSKGKKNLIYICTNHWLSFLTKCTFPKGVKDFWGIMSTFMNVCWKNLIHVKHMAGMSLDNNLLFSKYNFSLLLCWRNDLL